MKYHEQAVGQTSEWRTPKALLDAIGLTYGLDPCAPLDGYYAVEAKVRFTIRENGLVQSWRGLGQVFANPPWSERRRAVVTWLRKFNTEADGGIFVCVSRTSADWCQEHVFPHCDMVCFPDGKTRFFRPDGSPGPEPTNGIAILARGRIAVEALQQSGLGTCLFVDRTAVLPARLAKLKRATINIERARNAVCEW
jgi:hypothetical protein